MAKLIYRSPVGNIALVSDGNFLTKAEFTKEAMPEKQSPDDVLNQTARQLDEYFSGIRKKFDLPLAPQGTVFQQKVWNALLTIPYGATESYQEIACQTGNPKACRAVGMANNKNPIGIIIPCHRVIGKSGKLVGYAGGIKMKKYLLDMEKKYA